MSRITPELEALIRRLTADGVRSKAGLLRALESAGHKLNWRTLARHLESAAPAPVAPPVLLVQHAEAALEGDDLAELERNARVLRAAMLAWEPRLASEPEAARTYAVYTRLHADLSARLVELKPKPEAERDRLVALGDGARAELLERAVTVATADEVTDLRTRLEKMERVNRALLGANK